jgi:DNA repair protein RadC
MIQSFIPMPYKSIKEWPEDERPRERLLKHGPSNMSDAQLLAIILRTGGGGRSALDIGMDLLDTFHSFKELEQASLSEFSAIKGIGTAKAAQIRAALEIGKRLYHEPSPKGPTFASGQCVYNYFYPRMQGLRKEAFHCILLDVKNRLIRHLKISEGTLTASLIHPRESFRNAIKESAASLIFIHNHPSGDPTPSREDIAITEKLEEAGEILGIKMLDHIIVADGGYTSMLEKGYMVGK